MHIESIILVKQRAFSVAQHFVFNSAVKLNMEYTNTKISNVALMPNAKNVKAAQGIMAFVFSEKPTSANLTMLEQRILIDFQIHEIRVSAKVITVKPDTHSGSWVCFLSVEVIIEEIAPTLTLKAPCLNRAPRLRH